MRKERREKVRNERNKVVVLYSWNKGTKIVSNEIIEEQG